MSTIRTPADLPEGYTLGDPVYPSWQDAPDWHRIKVMREDGANWDWVEVNRPDPIYYTIHPNTDDTEMMLREEDYPPELRRAVRAYNAPYKATFRNRLSRAVMSPMLFATTTADAAEASRTIALFEASEGFTKTVDLGDCGFVVNPDGGGTKWRRE